MKVLTLKEVFHLRQTPGEPRRRWFESDMLDLIVWYDEAETLSGFHVCYDKTTTERALTWTADAGLSSALVDNGERRILHYKASPILVSVGKPADRKKVAYELTRVGAALPNEILGFVLAKLAGQ